MTDVMKPTLVYLGQICDQLTEAIGLSEGYKVGALIDPEKDMAKIQGWNIVKVQPDGKLINEHPEMVFNTIKDLVNAYTDSGL